MVQFAFSAPEAASAVSDVSKCGADIDPARSLIVPMTTTATITSSLAADLDVTFVAGTVTPDGHTYYLAEFASGPTCSEVTAGEEQPGVSWQQAPPNQPQTSTGYWVFPDAITPDHPNGDPVALGKALMGSYLALGGPQAEGVGAVGFTESGPAVVTCKQGQKPLLGIVVGGQRPTTDSQGDPCS